MKRYTDVISGCEYDHIDNIVVLNDIDPKDTEILDNRTKEVIKAVYRPSEYIRRLTNMSRAEFSKTYKIPVRTLEDWDAGKSKPADYVIDLLARAVYSDIYEKVVEFEVVTKSDQSDDEWPQLRTKSFLEAFRMGEKESGHYWNEIRIYTDEEECNWNELEYNRIYE